MGLRVYSRSSCRSSRCSSVVSHSGASVEPGQVVRGMPDPAHFMILRGEQVSEWVILEIVYPDCTNYEGRKILVYRGAELSKLWMQKNLDPHFCNHAGCTSPFARFEPTADGWKAARILCKEMSSVTR
jgi:hypothetical protein